ncbi:MAG: asparagine synthase C-terminal domain-containing protein [Candidatus Methanosuratincola sp.]
MPDLNPKARLTQLLREAILKGEPKALILSGGIDSSLLAALAPKNMLDLCVTALFEGSGARDRVYSRVVADRLGIRHAVVEYGIEEAEKAAREIVKLLGTFDHVEIRNDITIYVAIKSCIEEGIACAMTGDGGDELFAGYDYMTKMDELELDSYINSLTGKWSFSAIRLGAHLGVTTTQPYLDPEVVEFARGLPYEWRVRRSDRILGKWILRSLLEDLGLPEIAYRAKEPIELGSGSASLTSLLNEALGEEVDEIVEEAARDGVLFWSREQAYFYKIFKDVFGKVPRPSSDGPSCACCGAPLDANRINCRYCGFTNGFRG